MTRPTIYFARPRAGDVSLTAPAEPRLHPAYFILWMALLAVAGVLFWAMFSDHISTPP